MGMWGKGNFDSDTAADFLSIYISDIIDDIDKIIDTSTEIEPDEYEGVALLCKVEILTTLMNKKWVGCLCPEIDDVKMWSKKYLEVYDAYYNSAENEDLNFIKLRRDVIENTFNDYISSILNYD